ncbi:MAG: DUF4160 domain-containing protein [Nostoc sp. NMS7]|uniref:DUF4160 domain-containing protein n=1 Tax=Nostoc sp. NMS7 TaxID=2815391 RepID=UPI0025FFE3C1|nr:DUF4160 domain-containing protein [Nostoc sp. NMS7]MBN3946411.1 DUF4160 domain-containing protein [Nostoc sp. NMS7]
MAQVLADPQNNLYVYIYSDDHTPAHVHIFVGRKKSRSSKNIKINIGNNETPPKVLLAHPSIRNDDIKKAWYLVAKNQVMLLNEWKNIHEKQKVSKKTNQNILE